MNWWNVLEIPSYSDLKTIKKAYAKLLKVHNPEDDPQGYKKIREAYDEAVKYAKKNESSKQNNNKIEKNSNVDNSSFEDNKTKNEEIPKLTFEFKNNNHDNKTEKVKKPNKLNFEFEYNNYKDEKVKNKTNKKRPKLSIDDINFEHNNENKNLNEKMEEFLSELNLIYNDISLRRDINVWDELLNRDVVWNLHSIQIIENELLKFLLEHKYLPCNVWTMLRNNFNWTQNELKLYDKYPSEKIDEFLNNLKNPSELKYDYLDALESNGADKYLMLREQAYKMLKKKEYLEAKKYLFAAYALFNRDAELLRLIGDFYYDFNDYNNAFKFAKAAFKLNKFDFKSALHLGNILTMKKCFSKAIPHLELYLSFSSYNVIALTNLGYCYYYSNNFLKAREIFSKLLNISSENKIIKEYIQNIDLKLEGKDVRRLSFKTYKPKKKLMVDGKLVEKRSEFFIVFIIKRIIEYLIGHVKYLKIYAVIGIICIVLNCIYENRNTSNHPNDTYQNNMVQIKDDETFKAIKTNENLRKINDNMNVKLYVKNVKPINYFKLSNLSKDNMILSKEKIAAKNLNDKIESQLYLGIFNNTIIMFTDNSFQEDKLDENGGYILKGTVYDMDESVRYDIQNKCNNTYKENGLYWQGRNQFIDCSQILNK